MKKIKNKWWQWTQRKRIPLLWAVFRHSSHALRPEFKKITGAPLNCLFAWQKGTFTAYFNRVELDQTTDFLFKNFTKDVGLINKIKKEHYRRAKLLIKDSGQIFNADLNSKSNKELFLFFRKFKESYIDLTIYSCFSIFATYKLEDIVRKYLFNQCQKFKQENNLTQYFSVLTMTGQKSWSKIQEEALKKIAAKIRKDKSLKQIFSRDKPIFLQQKLQEDYPKLFRLIEGHLRAYQWVPYEFIGPTWTFNDMLEEIKIMLKEKKKASKRVKSQVIDAQQKLLVKELKISPQYLRLFKAIAQLIALKEYRNGIYNRVQFELAVFLKELVKRFNFSLGQVYYLHPDEIERVLLGKRLSKAELNKRRQLSCWVTKNFKEKILTGQAAKELIVNQLIETERKQKIVDKLHGNIANSGKVRGKARILRDASEINKVKKGDILVTTMTTPDYLPAMKKAAAIVTNEGGITCHAAIVSRELGIPCIIGTKIATQVLKDGDLVEVDANKGIVRIFKHN